MASKTKLSEDLKTIIVQRYLNGESASSLGKEFGVNVVTVISYVKSSGHNTRSLQQAILLVKKKCGKCKQLKPLKDFYFSVGFSCYCKPCHIEMTTANRNNNPDRYIGYERAKRLRRDFNIDLAQYWSMFDAQGGVCAICKRPETKKGRSGQVKSLAVDHNHATGEVRSLLCHSCNCGLGNFSENIEILTSAIAYIEKHNDYK